MSLPHKIFAFYIITKDFVFFKFWTKQAIWKRFLDLREIVKSILNYFSDILESKTTNETKNFKRLMEKIIIRSIIDADSHSIWFQYLSQISNATQYNQLQQ